MFVGLVAHFFKKDNSLLGIDIGSTAVKVVELQRHRQGFYLQSYAICPYKNEAGGIDGVDIDGIEGIKDLDRSNVDEKIHQFENPHFNNPHFNKPNHNNTHLNKQLVAGVRVEELAAEELAVEEFVIDRNITDTEAMGEVIAKAIQKGKFTTHKAVTAVVGTAVMSKIIELDAGLTEAEIEAQIRLDAEQYIPYPLDEVSFDFEVIGKSADNLGSNKVRLVVSRLENIEQRADSLIFAGLDAQIVDVESHAIYRACRLLPAFTSQQTSQVAVVDIVDKQLTLYVANLAQNGKQAEIAEGRTSVEKPAFVYSREQLLQFDNLHVHNELAEDGYLQLEANFEPKSELKPEAKHIVKPIVKPVVKQIVQHIHHAISFYNSSHHDANITQIIIMGGINQTVGLPSHEQFQPTSQRANQLASQLTSELTRQLQSELQVAVSLANPFQNMMIAPHINTDKLQQDAPRLMVACGLSLRAFKEFD